MKQTTFITLIGAAFLSLFASSCRTTYSFEALSPAMYTLPKGVDTVLLVCGVTPMVYSDTTKFVNKARIKTAADSERKLPLMTTTILFNELNKDGFLPAKVYNNVVTPEIISLAADSLCSKYNTSAILYLKGLYYENNTTSYNSSYNTYGLNVKTKGRCLWSFMTPDGSCRDMEPVEEPFDWIIDEFVIDHDYLSDLQDVIPRDVEMTYTIAEKLASSVASQLTPSWIEINRFVFFSHNRRFTKSMDYFYANNWDDARNTWINIYQDGLKANKIRAAINISLSYEREGDIRSASIWISKALDLLDSKRRMKFEKKYCKELFSNLEIRQQEVEKLDRQLSKS